MLKKLIASEVTHVLLRFKALRFDSAASDAAPLFVILSFWLRFKLVRLDRVAK